MSDTGAMPALLERLAVAVSYELIDELWLFPTRRMAGVESTVIVLALYTDQADRRRVATAHFKAVRNKRGEAAVETDLRDHAIAPPDRLIRVIDGVLRRLGDDLAATPPRTARISGEQERWMALLESLADGIEIEDALERVRLRAKRVGDVDRSVTRERDGSERQGDGERPKRQGDGEGDGESSLEEDTDGRVDLEQQTANRAGTSNDASINEKPEPTHRGKP